MGTYPIESAAGRLVAGLSGAGRLDSAVSVFFRTTITLALNDSSRFLLRSLFGFGCILNPFSTALHIFAETSHGVAAGDGQACSESGCEADEGY